MKDVQDVRGLRKVKEHSTSLGIKLTVSTKNIFLQTPSDTVNKSNLRQSVKERITFKNPF